MKKNGDRAEYTNITRIESKDGFFNTIRLTDAEGNRHELSYNASDTINGILSED